MKVKLQELYDALDELGEKIGLLDEQTKQPIDFSETIVDYPGARKAMEEVAKMLTPDDMIGETRPSDRTIMLFQRLGISIPESDFDITKYDIPPEIIELEKSTRVDTESTPEELMKREKHRYKRPKGVTKWLKRKYASFELDGMSSAQIAVEVRRHFKNSVITGDNVRQILCRIRKSAEKKGNQNENQ